MKGTVSAYLRLGVVGAGVAIAVVSSAQGQVSTTPAPPASTPPTVTAPTRPAPKDPMAPTIRRSWSARVLFPTVARASAHPRARVTSRVSPYAPYDRDPHHLLILGSARTGGHTWYRVLLPIRPNGTTGWVRADALQRRVTPMRLRVRVAARTLEILSNGRRIGRYRVAVGTRRNPTPIGLYAVSEIVPQKRTNGFYGPFIVTIAAHSERLSDFDGGNGQVAIHGTNRPDLLGRAISHGCVRMSNHAIRLIARRIPPGAPVEVLP